MGVGALLEASWYGADDPDSRVGRFVTLTNDPSFIVGLSTVPAESCAVAILFSVLWPFDLLRRPLASTFFVVLGTVDVFR